MTQRKKPTPAPIVIDGYELTWMLIRETQWSSQDDYQGIAISVRKIGPTRKELVVKYPFLGVKPNGTWHIPEKPRVTTKIVEDGIRQAIAAGWDPDSRGKTFTFFVEKAE